MKQIMILSMLLAAACATSPVASPRLAGPEADVIQLAGLWRAHVESDDQNIAGDIEFRVERDGEWVINNGGRVRAMGMRIEGNEVRAALEPYFDSTRGADVYTTFEGSLRGGEIHGVVWERVNFQWVIAGSWSAGRIAATITRAPVPRQSVRSNADDLRRSQP